MSPRHSIKAPMQAADRPLPNEDKTPPVTNINLVLFIHVSSKKTGGSPKFVSCNYLLHISPDPGALKNLASCLYHRSGAREYFINV